MDTLVDAYKQKQWINDLFILHKSSGLYAIIHKKTNNTGIGNPLYHWDKSQTSLKTYIATSTSTIQLYLVLLKSLKSYIETKWSIHIY